MVGGDSGGSEGHHGEAGVPDRRLARLGPKAVAVLDHERAPTFDRAAERVVLEAAAERREHHDRPDPRRLDPAPRAVGLLALLHPALGGGERAAADRARAQGALRLAGTGADLAELDGGVAHRAERPDHRERHDRLPRPAGEVVDRERGARREQDQLGRDRRDPLPRPVAEQRHEALREHAAARDAALAADVVEGLSARVDAGHLQRDVRLDRRREVGGALEPVRPGAVVTAPGEQVVGEAAVGVGVTQAEDVQPEEVLGDHRRVRLQLADPPAAWVLELEHAGGRLLDRGVEPGQGLRGAHSAAAFAAATPLRTAASIVAGQSEATQAPAR